MAQTKENWTRVTFTTDAATAQEKASRKRLRAAIEAAMEEFHGAKGIGVIAGVEMYPCDRKARKAA